MRYIRIALLVLLSTWISVPAQPSSSRLALVGGRIVDGCGGPPIENGVILIEGRRIIAVGPESTIVIPDGTRKIDTNGMTVLPGLWESHGHLHLFGAGAPPSLFASRFVDRTAEVMARTAEILLRGGVTSLRDLGGPLDLQLRLRDEIRSGQRPGPRLYLAGPTLRQVPKPSGLAEVGTAEQARQRVRELAARVDLISVDGFWDLEVLQALTDEAHRNGLGVDAGVRHTLAYETALSAGVDRLHTVFTTDPLSDYSPEELRRLIRGIRPLASGPSANILRGPYIAPTLEMRVSYVRSRRFPERLDHPRWTTGMAPDITAFLRETWANPATIPWGVGAVERMEVVFRKVKRFIEAGGREQIIVGTDSGSPLNPHPSAPREIGNLVAAGLPPMEAIQAATLRPAQMQGVANDLGTISAGKLADLIVVEGDPLENIRLLETAIVLVIKEGRIYR